MSKIEQPVSVQSFRFNFQNAPHRSQPWENRGDADMSSMHRTIEGDVLVNHLTRDEWMIDQDILAKHGRTARTLVKEGPLRLTVMAVGPGGNLPAHDTTGPVTIQVLEGELLFTALDREYPLKTGDVLVLAPGVEHSATSEMGGKFLLTVFHAPSAGSRLPAE